MDSNTLFFNTVPNIWATDTRLCNTWIKLQVQYTQWGSGFILITFWLSIPTSDPSMLLASISINLLIGESILGPWKDEPDEIKNFEGDMIDEYWPSELVLRCSLGLLLALELLDSSSVTSAWIAFNGNTSGNGRSNWRWILSSAPCKSSTSADRRFSLDNHKRSSLCTILPKIINVRICFFCNSFLAYLANNNSCK